jgi:hypothetical protein
VLLQKWWLWRILEKAHQHHPHILRRNRITIQTTTYYLPFHPLPKWWWWRRSSSSFWLWMKESPACTIEFHFSRECLMTLYYHCWQRQSRMESRDPTMTTPKSHHRFLWKITTTAISFHLFCIHRRCRLIIFIKEHWYLLCTPVTLNS